MRSRVTDRTTANHIQQIHNQNFIKNTLEKNSKHDKVHQKKLDQHNKCVTYYLPRLVCCFLLGLFCIGLMYRLTDRVIRHGSHDPHDGRPILPVGSATDSTTTPRTDATDLKKSESRHLSLLKHLHNKNKVSAVSGQNAHILTKQEKHLKHLQQHGNLLMAAKEHGTHQLGPHVPHNHLGKDLSESERQGNQVIRLKDKHGNNIIVTNCKEYLGDHVSTKSVTVYVCVAQLNTN